ncbi:MAG TPA: substrate-binding domain-containing protein [Pseudolabrys sp.]
MGARELKVISTGAYEHALKAIARMYEFDVGCDVRLDFGNARVVTSKVMAEQPVDVIMTSAPGMEDLAAKGRIDDASRTPVGKMRIGAAVAETVRAPEIATKEALKRALISAPSIAHIDPNGGGTTGPYFGKLFALLGISNEVERKAVLCATGREVVGTIASGRAALGLTQASELIGIAGVRFVDFLPSELQFLTVYEAAIASNCQSKSEAEEFLRYITSPKSAEQFLRAGWDLSELSENPPSRRAIRQV